MTDEQHLIEELRSIAETDQSPGNLIRNACRESTNYIEAQAAEIERLQVEAKAQFDRGYYDGQRDRQPTQSDVSFRELAAVLYRKSAEFQVGLTVEDSYTLAAEAIAFLQEQSK